MDIYSTRTAGFGFVLLAFSIATWAAVDFEGFRATTMNLLGSDANSVTLIVAAVGAVISFPVVGASIEFVARFLAELLRLRRDSFYNMKEIGSRVKELLALNDTTSPHGAYHLVLYSNCDAKIRDWAHRRRNRMYSVTANSLAAVSGLLIASVLLQGWSWLIALVCILYVGINIRVFYHELAMHDQLIAAWWDRFFSSDAFRNNRKLLIDVNSTSVND